VQEELNVLILLFLKSLEFGVVAAIGCQMNA